MAFPTQNGIYQCKDSINSWSNHLPKLQRCPARYVGRGPKKNMLGRYQYPLHKASELGNARLGAAKRNTGLNLPPVWGWRRVSGGSDTSGFTIEGRPVCWGKAMLFFSPKRCDKIEGNTQWFLMDIWCLVHQVCKDSRSMKTLVTFVLVKEVDDKTIPSDTSGLRDTTN